MLSTGGVMLESFRHCLLWFGTAGWPALQKYLIASSFLSVWKSSSWLRQLWWWALTIVRTALKGQLNHFQTLHLFHESVMCDTAFLPVCFAAVTFNDFMFVVAAIWTEDWISYQAMTHCGKDTAKSTGSFQSKWDCFKLFSLWKWISKTCCSADFQSILHPTHTLSFSIAEKSWVMKDVN